MSDNVEVGPKRSKKWFFMLITFGVVFIVGIAFGGGFIVGNNKPVTDEDVERYLTVDSSITMNPGNKGNPPATIVNKVMDRCGIDVNTIIQIGEKIIDFIVKNQPVSKVEMGSAGAVPAMYKDDPFSLYGFEHSTWSGFSWVLKNPYSVTVTSMNFAFDWSAKGTEGKGQYLMDLRVLPDQVVVVWGYTADASASFGNPMNYGTKDAPMAGLTADAKLTVKTVLKHIYLDCSVIIYGDGSGKIITC